MTLSPPDLARLPGGELAAEGLADAKAGRRSIPACLVWIGRPRLVRHGLLDPALAPQSAEPERELYRMLQAEPGDAYSRYNALLRRWTSFQRALDRMPSTPDAP